MQFDSRIKDLILQGESALIVEILKQLYERDENKNIEDMKNVKILEKMSVEKLEKTVKNPTKPSSLDIKKINMQKNPDDAESSLEFLILLLTTSLGISIEEIISLFSNQNKYLAYVIVKGMNDDFSGIVLFYTLLNKHSEKLRFFCESDPRDGYSCLYAIKPGFMSKDRKVSELTINLFGSLGRVYDWFISEEGMGFPTFTLGMRRHPELIDEFLELLLDIIKNNEETFFSQNFKPSFQNPAEMIEVCDMIIEPLGKSFLMMKLIDEGIISDWIYIASQLVEGSLEEKLLCYSKK